ncbi:MAG: MFS transporter [Chloroflexi bacterium]|jgi:predicted MFS family arabinose efflux permease|nr:MFS transporter [Chloroflexota bacterium]MBT4513874.1 MFS transporter [Chloroflexota bacterium]MBT6682216.1 MFS transporter [Chloroflexota bacterium]
MAASEPNSGPQGASTDDASPPDRGSLISAPAGAAIPSTTTVPQADDTSSGISRVLSRTFESLRNRQFLFLWFGMMAGMSGTQMQFFARGVLVFDITDENFLLTGVVGVGFGPAMLIGSIVAPVLSMRVEGRLMIQMVQAGQVILAASIATLLLTDTLIWQHMLIASVIQGGLFSFMMPVRQVMIPKMVGRELMSNAMSLNAAAMSLTAMAAPAIGGVLYWQLGPEGVYIVVAALNVVAVLVTGMIGKFPPNPNAPRRSVLASWIEGFRHVSTRKTLMQVMIFSGVAALLTMPFRMMLPPIAIDLYDASEVETGILVGVVGVGSLIGALGIANLRSGQKRGMILLMTSVASGVAFVLFSSLPIYWVGIILMIPVGFAEVGRFALGQALSMELTDDEHRAHVASLFMMSFSVVALGMLPLGIAMELVGAQASMMGLGVILLVSSVLFMGTMRGLRRMG